MYFCCVWCIASLIGLSPILAFCHSAGKRSVPASSESRRLQPCTRLQGLVGQPHTLHFVCFCARLLVWCTASGRLLCRRMFQSCCQPLLGCSVSVCARFCQLLIGCSVRICASHVSSLFQAGLSAYVLVMLLASVRLFCRRMFQLCCQPRLGCSVGVCSSYAVSLCWAVLSAYVLVMLSASNELFCRRTWLSCCKAVLSVSLLVMLVSFILTDLYVPTRIFTLFLFVLFHILVLSIYPVLFSLSFIVLQSNIFNFICAVRLFSFV